MSLKQDLDRFRGCRVMVTGHTGFKGSWLTFLLTQAGAHVTGVSLPPATVPSHFNLLGLEQDMDSQTIDIRHLDALRSTFRSAKPEFVFHLAAQAFVRRSYGNPLETFTTNLGGSINVLQCAYESPSVKTLVFVTSDKCYKNTERLSGYSESDELGGVDPYSTSKAGAEMVFAGYANSLFAESNAPRIASARAGNVVGGGDWSPDRLIPDCIRSLSSGHPIQIRSPRATRPWQHVLEPLSGYIRLACALQDGKIPSGSSWNFGPDEKSIHDVEEVSRLVALHWDLQHAIVRSSDPKNLYESQLLQLDSSKARNELQWSSRWNFRKTIDQTVKWYKKVSCGVSASQATEHDISEYLGHD